MTFLCQLEELTKLGQAVRVECIRNKGHFQAIYLEDRLAKGSYPQLITRLPNSVSRGTTQLLHTAKVVRQSLRGESFQSVMKS